jgi:hypothetical protein
MRAHSPAARPKAIATCAPRWRPSWPRPISSRAKSIRGSASTGHIQLADDSSGIDAVKDILAEFSVPVIFITAFPERLLTGERPEPTFLITKPFQRETVKTTISQALFFDQATVPA